MCLYVHVYVNFGDEILLMGGGGGGGGGNVKLRKNGIFLKKGKNKKLPLHYKLKPWKFPRSQMRK